MQHHNYGTRGCRTTRRWSTQLERFSLRVSLQSTSTNNFGVILNIHKLGLRRKRSQLYKSSIRGGNGRASSIQDVYILRATEAGRTAERHRHQIRRIYATRHRLPSERFYIHPPLGQKHGPFRNCTNHDDKSQVWRSQIDRSNARTSGEATEFRTGAALG